MSACVPDTAHVVGLWATALADDPAGQAADAATEVLDPATRDRLSRVRDPALRALHLRAAAWVRAVVGAVLDAAVAEVRLGATPFGKPVVVSPPRSDLEISVSHSFPWVAVAASGRGPVGVDVERARDAATLDLAAAGVLSAAESAVLEAGPMSTSSEAPVVLWAAKEAVLKATGLGLRLPPDSVTVTLVESSTGHLEATSADLAAGSVHDGHFAVRTTWLAGGFALVVATRLSDGPLMAIPLTCSERPDGGKGKIPAFGRRLRSPTD